MESVLRKVFVPIPDEERFVFALQVSKLEIWHVAGAVCDSAAFQRVAKRACNKNPARLAGRGLRRRQILLTRPTRLPAVFEQIPRSCSFTDAENGAPAPRGWPGVRDTVQAPSQGVEWRLHGGKECLAVAAKPRAAKMPVDLCRWLGFEGSTGNDQFVGVCQVRAARLAFDRKPRDHSPEVLRLSRGEG